MKIIVVKMKKAESGIERHTERLKGEYNVFKKVTTY